ncbi:MAG: DUF2127 domain-containing protein [Kofleriaceae bacterium]
MRERHDRLIVLIGVLKLVKALVLLAAAISVFATLHDGVRAALHEFAAGSGREVVMRYVGHLIDGGPHHTELIGGGLLAYAALFAVEGAGLLSHRVWGEWLTICITTSFIPLEIYELVHKSSFVKAAVLVANILIAIYLVGRRIHASHRHGLRGWLRERFGR